MLGSGMLWIWMAAAGALVLPPSTKLEGKLGTLEWTVLQAAPGIIIDGTSPRWVVHHEAKADFTPILTRRSNPAGRKVVILYDAKGAEFSADGETIRIEREGLWDSESVDLRLGAAIAAGFEEVEFPAIDTDSGKVYTFAAQIEEKTRCDGTPCTHVELHLTGFYRLVGPSWDYWFDARGKLLRFEAKWGQFRAVKAAPDAPQER